VRPVFGGSDPTWHGVAWAVGAAGESGWGLIDADILALVRALLNHLGDKTLVRKALAALAGLAKDPSAAEALVRGCHATDLVTTCLDMFFDDQNVQVGRPGEGRGWAYHLGGCWGRGVESSYGLTG
jgi:hypothetical protein